MTSTPRVEGTRERVLAILRRSDGATVDDLATEVGLAGATVRRHLDVLLRDGHVAIRQAKGRTGRPRYIFSLTEAGADLFPHHYVRLTHRLLDEIVSLDKRETQGRDGRALAGLVFERMAERLALEYGPRLRSGNLEERARRAATLLAEEGIDFEVMPAPGPVAATAGAVHLVGRGCPCRRVGQVAQFEASGRTATVENARSASAGSTLAGCEHDRRLLERLLGDRVTILTQDALPGDSLCGYRLDPTPAMPSTPLVPLA